MQLAHARVSTCSRSLVKTRLGVVLERRQPACGLLKLLLRTAPARLRASLDRVIHVEYRAELRLGHCRSWLPLPRRAAAAHRVLVVLERAHLAVLPLVEHLRRLRLLLRLRLVRVVRSEHSLLLRLLRFPIRLHPQEVCHLLLLLHLQLASTLSRSLRHQNRIVVAAAVDLQPGVLRASHNSGSISLHEHHLHTRTTRGRTRLRVPDGLRRAAHSSSNLCGRQSVPNIFNRFVRVQEQGSSSGLVEGRQRSRQLKHLRLRRHAHSKAVASV